MENARVGADQKWITFQADYEANFARPISPTERAPWEMFARRSDFDLTKQTMRHFANSFANAKLHNNLAAKPGLAEFQKYYDFLVSQNKKANPVNSSCEYCRGNGYAVVVYNCKNNGAVKLAMRQLKYGIYAAENPQVFTVPCVCEAGRTKAEQDSACPDWWHECLFKGQNARSLAQDYADKCRELFLEKVAANAK